MYVDTVADILCRVIPLVTNEQAKLIQSLLEQVKFILVNPHKYRYSTDLIILASIFFSISPHAYKFVRSSKMLILPHPNTIKKVCAKYDTNPLLEQNDSYFLNYVKNRFGFLEEKEHLVMLLFDEIHIKSVFDYKGGNIVGAAFNSEKAAKTAFVFMIKSFLSNFKEVAHILPVRQIEAETVYSIIKKVIVGLHNIGYKVLCVVSDNNAINRKAMSFFNSPPELKICYSHPCSNEIPLYYLFDSVHIFKCLRNNWLNKKDVNQTLNYPPLSDSNDESEFCQASFCSLKHLYAIEENMLVKFAYSLTRKSLFPSNFERQNVKYVMNLFHESVIEGLLHYGSEKNLKNYESTADFLKMIVDWWSVVNVKTVFKGVRRKNSLEYPLLVDNEPFKFLAKFSNWSQKWNKFSDGLTKETYTALTHSAQALLSLTKYCIETLHFSYVLPGKIQTDSLEARFGDYRTLAGSQYLISIRQIFEVENKLRLQSILPLQLSSKKYGKICVDMNDIENIDCKDDALIIHENLSQYHIDVELENFMEDIDSCLPNLTYISGCCLRRAISKVKKCSTCTDALVLKKNVPTQESQYKIIQNLDRGGLILPHPDVVSIVMLTYAVVQQLISNENELQFLQSNQQRQIVEYFSLQAVEAEGEFDSLNHCTMQNHSELLRKFVIRCATNTFLNNYVKKRNQEPAVVVKKRKVETVK